MAKVYAISDLHVDMKENNEWVTALSPTQYTSDILIVAGDVTDNVELLKRTLASLKTKFAQVFFCPGNHELWIKDSDRKAGLMDSIAKFHHILAMCEEVGVQTKPATVSGVTIVPLFGWYDRSLFLPASHLTDDMSMWTDHWLCVWPEELKNSALGVPKYFVEFTKRRLESSGVGKPTGPTITFSHFFSSKKLIVAHRDFTKNMDTHRKECGFNDPVPPPLFNFSSVCGTDLLHPLISKLHPSVHVVGHSHRRLNATIGGVKYVNNPLGYPFERENGLVLPPIGLQCVYAPKEEDKD